MKLSFSTKGFDGFSFEELTDISKEMGFLGIEVNSEFKDLSTDENSFSREKIAATTRSLHINGIELICLDVAAKDINNASLFLEKAKELNVPYLSLHFDKEVSNCEAIGIVKNLLPEAKINKIRLLISTDGAFSSTKSLCSILDEFASDYLGALWSCHNTYFDVGETPSETIKNLGAYIKHVHIADIDDKGNFTCIGEGTIPVNDIVRALSSVDYDGFVSMVFDSGFNSSLSDYQVILPHFVSYMRKFEANKNQNRLYFNYDGSGRYIWKKDELIDMTFSRVLDRLAEEFPDQYAFKYTTLDYTRTYTEFRKDVDDFARALVSMGVRPGYKVSVWATNVPEWFIAFWAVTKIGAVLVSVNTAYKIHEIEYLLRQSDTHTLIMINGSKDSDYAESINELCPEIKATKPGSSLHCKRLPFLRNVITVGFKMSGCLSFEEALDKKSDTPLSKIKSMANSVKPTDVCNMQYTSGTTGFPKGVMLTHYNVINNGKCIGDRMGLSTADRMMIQVPMFHCFGMVLSMTASVTHGTTMCPLPYFSAKASLDCINQEKITCFNGVPTMFIAMFNHADYRKTDFSYMRTGIMAGSGCPPELMKKAANETEMNMRGIVSVYGQTETSPGNTMTEWTDPLEMRCNTVGYPFPHVKCKVIDPETGEELPEGENGEFCAKGYNTMKGYYKMPDETESAIDKDGWLHSGDIARKNSDGTYLITGRLKDMIIRGGENIYPKEIEEFIYTHPDVSDVQVIGVPDEKYGEEAAACIILKKGCAADEGAMREYIGKNLAAHKVPKYIIYVDSFPMNAAGKVLKYRMREEIEKLINK